MGKTVLITGGAGYIGSHVCKILADNGFLPVTYDNLSRGNKWAVQWGQFEKGDILDSDRLEEVFVKHKPVAVMHFAALSSVGESVKDPMPYYRINVCGTLSLLDAMRKNGVEKMLFSSSCAIYGEHLQAQISENQIKKPINPYGMSKLAVENILADYDSAYKLKSISLRYFNAAGADPDCKIGEVHKFETRIIPILLEVANGTRQNFTIYGSDYDTPDGTCVRDFIHVNDIANAHILALKELLNNYTSASYNLGNGNGFSVKEIIQCVREVTNQPISTQLGPRRPGDPSVLVSNSQQAISKLGWTPERSSLTSIIEDAWRWSLHFQNK